MSKTGGVICPDRESAEGFAPCQRAADLAGYTQEECAAQMGVARTTVQGVYNDARRKVAESLVDGKVLVIKGGDYDLCEGTARPCGRKCHPICCKKDEKHEGDVTL